MKHRHIAVIDIGSNSVRMVIFDLLKSKSAPVFNEKVFCGLGRDLNRTGSLNKNGRKTALLTLEAFALLARAKQVQKIIAVGTAALRDAKDGKQFIESVFKKTNIKIKIIKGEEEAYFAALGVLAFDPKAEGLVADFGGGSLEIAEIKRGVIHNGETYPFGAFRVDRLGSKIYETVKQSLRTESAHQIKIKNLYIIGGSWRALLQCYFMHLSIEEHRLQGFKISATTLKKFCALIETKTPKQLIALYDIESHRAELLRTSSRVLRATIDAFKALNVIVSTAGIRDGVLVHYTKEKKNER
jgi:exopolyphosphatase/guanosine-5'-triphosphate,3'-diphosphate pyrophosphatase